jgi:hypothetical protein
VRCYLAARPHRPICARCRAQHLAAHLRTKRRLGTKAAAGRTVHCVPVQAPRFDDDRNEQVAGAGLGWQSGKRPTFGVLDQDRGCALRRCRFWGSVSRRRLIYSIAIRCDSGQLAFNPHFPPQIEIWGLRCGRLS